jgi:hypothetical protein
MATGKPKPSASRVQGKLINPSRTAGKVVNGVPQVKTKLSVASSKPKPSTSRVQGKLINPSRTVGKVVNGVPQVKTQLKAADQSEGKVVTAAVSKKPKPRASSTRKGMTLPVGSWTQTTSGKVLAKYNYAPGTGGGKVTAVMAKNAKVDAAKAKAPKTEAAKQMGLLTQPASARKTAAAKAKIQAIKGRRAAAATPSGRGASIAAAKKNTPGTVTRGKSNPVLDAMRNAAGALTNQRQRAQNEKLWSQGGNRPKTKPKGK